MKQSLFKYLFRTVSLILMLLNAGGVQSQEPAALDSVEKAYLSGGFPPGDSLEILAYLAKGNENPAQILKYSNWLIEVAERQDSIPRQIDGYRQKGHAFRFLGDFSNALDNYFKAAGLAIEIGSDTDLGTSYVTVADVYSLMDNNRNALLYYNKAIEILSHAGNSSDSVYLASALSNAGDEYYKQAKQDSALLYFEQAGAIFKALSNQIGIGYYLGSVGMVYSAQGQNDLAL